MIVAVIGSDDREGDTQANRLWSSGQRTSSLPRFQEEPSRVHQSALGALTAVRFVAEVTLSLTDPTASGILEPARPVLVLSGAPFKPLTGAPPPTRYGLGTPTWLRNCPTCTEPVDRIDNHPKLQYPCVWWPDH